METPEYPPNSDVSKRAPEPEDKDLKRVTTSEPVRKRRSLRKQFSETFFAGDVKSAIRYVIFDVLLMAARDTVSDAISAGTDKVLYGEGRRHRGPSFTRFEEQRPVINYNRPYQSSFGGSRMPSSQRALSRQARSQHDFDEILLESRVEAEQVIDQLFEVVNRYGTATVSDLYQLVGLADTHTDHKWGWTDLRGAGVSRDRDGFILDLPNPIPLG